MPPLTDPANRYHHLASELAYYRSAPVRKGGKAARKQRVRDLETALRVTVEAMRDACEQMYAALDERGRRLVHADMRRWYARNKSRTGLSPAFGK